MSTDQPPALRGALKALQREFDALYVTFGHPTRDLCYARGNSEYRYELDQWWNNYPSLRGHIAGLKQTTKDTPSSFVIPALLDCFVEMLLFGIRPIDQERDLIWIESDDSGIRILNDPIQPIFGELVKLGRKYEAYLPDRDGIAWAGERMVEMIASHRPAMRDWIAWACDGKLHNPSWEAPAYLTMEPVGHDPYDPVRAMTRLDAATSAKVIDALIDEYESRLLKRVEHETDAANLTAPIPSPPKPDAQPKTVERKGKAVKDQGKAAKQPTGKISKVDAKEEEQRIRNKLEEGFHIRKGEAATLWRVDRGTIYDWIGAKYLKTIR